MGEPLLSPSSSAQNNMAKSRPTITIRQATSDEDIRSARSLFRAYAEWLNVDMTFQDFATELASLPGKYQPSAGGALLLACAEGNGQDGGQEGAGDGESVLNEPTPLPVTHLGAVGLRPVVIAPPYTSAHPTRNKTCEIKRLYVVPEARGMGIARELVAAMMRTAEELGYEEMLLDSLDRLTDAIKLYEKMGFVKIEPYYANPLAGVIYMSKTLKRGQGEDTTA